MIAHKAIIDRSELPPLCAKRGAPLEYCMTQPQIITHPALGRTTPAMEIEHLEKQTLRPGTSNFVSQPWKAHVNCDPLGCAEYQTFELCSHASIFLEIVFPG